ncbi:MAG: Ig-like domain-containing protein [Verrucomicrobia bacterium]|nr:Ig-like domain-containing protein [Verrucomicrobiota bacterium]
MKTTNQSRSKLALATAAITIGAFTTTPARAGIEVTPDHIVSGSVSGKLIAIDVPTPLSFPYPGDGDSIWVGDAGVIATVADNGFQIIAGAGIQEEQYGDSNWEPDGTPFGESKNWAGYPGTVVLFNFNLAASGIDLPDGSIINAIYTTWRTRDDTAYYTYTEGTASAVATFNYNTAPAADLVLRWTDNVGVARNANFGKIFSNPITVVGGDGFTLRQERRANTAHLDAVIIDVTIPSSGTPPTIDTYSPGLGATNVPVTTNLVATFSEGLVLTGNGSVTIKNLDDGTGNSDIAIPLPDAAQVSVDGKQLTIDPSVNLAVSTNYSVRISADAIKDASGDAFAGILDDTWTFTTSADGTPPTIASVSPADEATGVAPYGNVVATFDEDVVLTGTGTVKLRNLTLGAGSDLTINLPNSQVSVSGTQLTIDRSANHLKSSTDYAVQISASAIKDLNGNPFAGIADDITWNFTTAAPPSGGIEVTTGHIVGTPTYGVTGTLVAIDVPYAATLPASGGPDWPEDCDDGFTTVNSPLRDLDGTSNWEPDGTPISEANAYMVYNGGVPSVTWTFGVPDGSVINAVYATWNTRTTDGITYQYSEGAASGSIVRQTGSAAPTATLILSWTDSASGSHQGSFERIFTGPITVEGGDGFTLWGTDNIGQAAHIDAVVLDVTLPGGLTGYALWKSTNAPTTGSDPNADEDGDGVANGVEYVLGGDKDTNDLGKLPQSSTDGADVLFTFVRDQTSIDGSTTVVIEVSTDLVNWATPPSPYTVGTDTAGSSTGVTVEQNVPEAGKDKVTLRLARAPDTAKFARLKVSVP